MMTQDRTISGHQLSVTAFVLMLSPALRLFPSAAAEQAGRSAPLAALLAFFPAALYLFLVCRAAALRREGEGLCALLARALPGRAGRMALGVLCLWLLAYAGFVLRSGADRFIVAVYPGAPPAFFVLTMAAAALAAAFAPYRDACRTAKLVFPAVGGVLALVLAFSLGKVRADNLLPLVARHVYNQENTLAAVLRCDRKLGFTTFMNDPQLASVSPRDGQRLFDDMLENQRAFLPAGWFA